MVKSVTSISDPTARPGPLSRIAHLLHVDVPEVWIRFLIAIVGLVLAFGAALFSTVSRESGNLWATLILASAALLLAVFVGLTTVPYLARRVAIARLRDAFHYDVTRVGVAYVLVVLIIGIAALNTGNNLLYIIVAALLAAILVSGVASAAVLRDLELVVRIPDHLFAGRSALGRILLRNSSKIVPSFSVTIGSPVREKNKKTWKWTTTSFGVPPWKPRGEQWLQLPDRKLIHQTQSALPGIVEGSVYFPYLAPGSELSAQLELRFDRRGRYQQDTFALSTLFPFAFLKKTRSVHLPQEIIVYPPVEPTDEMLEILPMITGEFETFVRGRGNDLYRIREYLPEDSARHVDWKATAKSGSLKVREFSREDERKLRIIFDQPAKAAISEQAFESGVALAASLSWHFANEDTDISFAAQDYAGGPDIYQFLKHLALVEPCDAPSLLEQIQPSDDYNIIVTARPKGSIPTRLWACSYFVFMK